MICSTVTLRNLPQTFDSDRDVFKYFGIKPWKIQGIQFRSSDCISIQSKSRLEILKILRICKKEGIHTFTKPDYMQLDLPTTMRFCRHSLRGPILMQKMYGYIFLDPHFIHLEVVDILTDIEWRLSIGKKTLYQAKMDNVQVENK